VYLVDYKRLVRMIIFGREDGYACALLKTERAEIQASSLCGHVKGRTCVTRRPITGLIRDHKTNLLLSLLLSTPCAHLVADYDLPSVSTLFETI
jgi:hypothetical protein